MEGEDAIQKADAIKDQVRMELLMEAVEVATSQKETESEFLQRQAEYVKIVFRETSKITNEELAEFKTRRGSEYTEGKDDDHLKRLCTLDKISNGTAGTSEEQKLVKEEAQKNPAHSSDPARVEKELAIYRGIKGRYALRCGQQCINVASFRAL